MNTGIHETDVDASLSALCNHGYRISSLHFIWLPCRIHLLNISLNTICGFNKGENEIFVTVELCSIYDGNLKLCLVDQSVVHM